MRRSVLPLAARARLGFAGAGPGREAMGEDVPGGPAASPVPEIADVALADLSASVRAGIRDFRRAPLHGILFSGVYVLSGWLLAWLGAGTLRRVSPRRRRGRRDMTVNGP